jgi:protocatechuate 3,4-dioxygenase beta subunit
MAMDSKRADPATLDRELEVPALPVTSRREALQLLGTAGVGWLVGCGADAAATETSGAEGIAGASGVAGSATSGQAGSAASGGFRADSAPTALASGGAGAPAAAGSGAGRGGASAAAGSGGPPGSANGTAGAPSSSAGSSGANGAAGSRPNPDAGTASDAGSAATSDAGEPNAMVACPDEDTPDVPEGPYYHDSMMNRSDITDGKEGVPITYRFTLLDGDCRPVEGAVIDIWQADKDGVYSAYAEQGTAGEVFLRGFQYTDAQGRATFKSIYPGWYSGRVTHLHGKVFIGGVQQDTTNFFFPKAIEEIVYASALYAARGPNNVSVARDIELRGDISRFDALTMTVTGDVASGYVASYVVKYS